MVRHQLSFEVLWRSGCVDVYRQLAERANHFTCILLRKVKTRTLYRNRKGCGTQALLPLEAWPMRPLSFFRRRFHQSFTFEYKLNVVECGPDIVPRKSK